MDVSSPQEEFAGKALLPQNCITFLLTYYHHHPPSVSPVNATSRGPVWVIEFHIPLTPYLPPTILINAFFTFYTITLCRAMIPAYDKWCHHNKAGEDGACKKQKLPRNVSIPTFTFIPPCSSRIECISPEGSCVQWVGVVVLMDDKSGWLVVHMLQALQYRKTQFNKQFGILKFFPLHCCCPQQVSLEWMVL